MEPMKKRLSNTQQLYELLSTQLKESGVITLEIDDLIKLKPAELPFSQHLRDHLDALRKLQRKVHAQEVSCSSKLKTQAASRS